MTGLAAAWMLGREHDVSLFDRLPVIGLVAHSFQSTVDGIPIRGDVPSRMFNCREWPTICRLLEILEVPSDSVTASVAIFDDQGGHLLRTADALSPWRMSLRGLARPAAVRIVRDARRLHREGQRDADEPELRFVSMATYLRDRNYSLDFITGFLYPILSSTICTCSHAALDQYPASILLNVLRNLTDRQTPLLRVRGGVVNLCERMLDDSPISLRLRVDVGAIRRNRSQVEIDTGVLDGEPRCESYDHVILAVQANQVSRLVDDLSPPESAVLNSVAYESVSVRVISRDESDLPPNVDLETFNIWPSETPGGSSRCVVRMNRFHTEWPRCADYYQVIQPESRDTGADGNFDSVIRLQRPVVSVGSWDTWRRLSQLSMDADRRVWFAGSFAEPGVPLLESAIRSATRIVRRLDPDNERANLLENYNRKNQNVTSE